MATATSKFPSQLTHPSRAPLLYTFTPTYHHDTYPSIHPSNFTATLTNKSVLITGASKGIGRTTALRYALAGASHIAIAARSPLDEVVSAILDAARSAGHPPPQVLPLTLDVSSLSSVQAAAEAVSNAFDGKLDILIANAGYSDKWAVMAEADPVNWWKTVDVSLNGMYLCSKYFMPLLVKGSLKTIIALSSIGALDTAPRGSAYQIAKFAVNRLVEFIDREHGETDGIVAVSIHPGGVDTELSRQLPGEYSKFLVDTPELAGDAMVWLGSGGREWLAGRFIFVNWDVDELEGRREEIVEGDLLKFRLAL